MTIATTFVADVDFSMKMCMCVSVFSLGCALAGCLLSKTPFLTFWLKTNPSQCIKSYDLIGWQKYFSTKECSVFFFLMNRWTWKFYMWSFDLNTLILQVYLIFSEDVNSNYPPFLEFFYRIIDNRCVIIKKWNFVLKKRDNSKKFYHLDFLLM